MDFKKQIRNNEIENDKKERNQLKNKHQHLHRYEQSFERNRKNFLNGLSLDNKRKTEDHYRMQTISNKTFKNNVFKDSKFGSIEHGKDQMFYLEKKNENKRAMIKNQQEEIRQKLEIKKEKDMFELK
jgi:hypothetical protein